MTFDVKGAFNGVAREVLLHRLRQDRIPEQIVRWIDNFCDERRATITLNGVTSECFDLTQAGLPQGSPLSPILLLFFNASLVQGSVNKRKGSFAFVDDYSACVTGSTVEKNMIKLK